MISTGTQTRKEAIVMPRGTATTGEPLNVCGDIIYLKVTGAETEGKYVILETITPPNMGPPLHVHHREDENFYIIEGDFVFEVDGKRLELHAGDYAYAPRDVPHCFQNAGKTDGRILLIIEPAGIENFFRDVAAIPGPPDPSKLVPIALQYGLEILGPPLGARSSS